jgi:hypothetical protein
LGVGICLSLLSAGCAKAQAKGAPDGPPLRVPAAPARVLAPVDEPVNASAPPPETPPATAAAPASRPPARPPARRPETERPPEPATASAPVEPAAPAEPRELRPASPARDAAAEKDVRDTLARVTTDLSRVDYRRLSADARSQYDQSKRFVQQAEQAVKDRNFVFAATLADKAETLAVGLQGR